MTKNDERILTAAERERIATQAGGFITDLLIADGDAAREAIRALREALITTWIGEMKDLKMGRGMIFCNHCHASLDFNIGEDYELAHHSGCKVGEVLAQTAQWVE